MLELCWNFSAHCRKVWVGVFEEGVVVSECETSSMLRMVRGSSHAHLLLPNCEPHR